MAPSFDTLAYAQRLREAGFTERQAEGQAAALAATMTDTLATKQDLREFEARLGTRFAEIDSRFGQVDLRFAQIDSRFARIDSRLDELSARFDAKLAEQSQQLTMRMMLAVGVVSALVKIL